LSQEKAGGSASNDSNLCSQGRGPFYSSLAEIGFDYFFIFSTLRLGGRRRGIEHNPARGFHLLGTRPFACRAQSR
jgi:hypothetical protein